MTERESGSADQQVLAETQVAGFGLANGKVLERLLLEFDEETPAAKAIHERIDCEEPLRNRDPHLDTLGEIVANPHDSHRTGEQKLEVGSSHGKDRIIVDYHEHTPRVYVRHEHFDGGEWTESGAWELHPATGVEEVATDGGQPVGSTDHPGVETIGAGGGPRDDPKIPCHGCGSEERFTAMKRSDDWTLTYLDDGSGQWVAYCSKCDESGEEETSIAKADAMVPKTWDEICGMTEEDSLRL